MSLMSNFWNGIKDYLLFDSQDLHTLLDSPVIKNSISRDQEKYYETLASVNDKQIFDEIEYLKCSESTQEKAFKWIALVHIIEKKYRENSEKKEEYFKCLKGIEFSETSLSSAQKIEAISSYLASQNAQMAIELQKAKMPIPEEDGKVLKTTGIKYVFHTTEWDKIVSILKMKKMIPGICSLIPWVRSGYGGNAQHKDRFVFMSVLPKLSEKDWQKACSEKKVFEMRIGLEKVWDFKPNKVTLVFSKKILSGKQYHFSLQHLYGKKQEGQTIDAKDIGRLSKIPRSALLFKNELVFYETMELSCLKELWVLPPDRDSFIALLKKNKISFAEDPDYTCVKGVDNYPETLLDKTEEN